jgi:hypothetical protein
VRASGNICSQTLLHDFTTVNYSIRGGARRYRQKSEVSNLHIGRKYGNTLIAVVNMPAAEVNNDEKGSVFVGIASNSNTAFSGKAD